MEEWPDYRENRRRNLRIIAERWGTSEIIKRLQIPKQRVSALIGLNPTREVGNEMARRVESAFGYPKNWLDNPHEEQSWLEAVFEYAKTSHPDSFPYLLRIIEGLIQDRGPRNLLATPPQQSDNADVAEGQAPTAPGKPSKPAPSAPSSRRATSTRKPHVKKKGTT